MTRIKGRSFKRRDVTQAELRALARGFDAAKQLFGQDMTRWDYDVVLVEGDLVVDGPLRLIREKLAGLLVTGNLTVRGTYADSDDPASGSIVVGDMEAENIVTAGSLTVGGDLRVRGGLLGDYNDYRAEVRGETRAGFLHTEEHWFEFKGAVHADVVLGRPRGRWPRSTKLVELPASAYPDRLVSAVFDRETLTLDKVALRRRTAKGLPVLRPTTTKRPRAATPRARTYQDLGARFFRTPRRAWVIWREGKVVVTQDGKERRTDAQGRPSGLAVTVWEDEVRVELPSEPSAKAEVARRIAEKVKRGFSEP